jgi:hypothetical protein
VTAMSKPTVNAATDSVVGEGTDELRGLHHG